MRETMHKSAETFFSSQTTLVVCAAIGSILWLTNASFNLTAKDYLCVESGTGAYEFE